MKINFIEFKTLSNLLSLIRALLAVPVFYLLAHINENETIRWLTFAVIIVAAATDYFDGYFARKFDEVTEVGKFLDPLADKIMVGVIIIRLFMLGMIPAYYFWIIILRDVVIFIGGIFVSRKLGKIIPSNKLGKVTVFAIGLFILIVIGGVDPSNWIYLLFFYGSIILSFASVIGYGIRAKEFINWEKNGTL